MIVRRDDGGVLLQQRPETGLWGGFWTFPQFDSQDEAFEWLRISANALASVHCLAPYSHAFTHFDLTLQPVVAEVSSASPAPEGHLWYDVNDPPRVGVTKPVTALLAQLAAGTQTVLALRTDETHVVRSARREERHELVGLGLDL